MKTETVSDFRNLEGVLAADRRATAHLVPPADMAPSAWAEDNVVIPVGNAIPGPISFDNAPMQRGLMNVVKEPGIQRVDYMLGAQLGKTTVLQCLIGYNIAHEPRSQIMTQPSEGDLLTFLETKLRPMLQENPKITARMAKPRGRDGVNNSRMISYIGGFLMFGWAGSPKTARGRSAPWLLMDEIDGYPLTDEGDYTELLSQRGATFGDDFRDIRSSTPVDMATSRIYKGGWLLGDQRRWYVRCPHCEHLQYFQWKNVWWQGRRSKDISDSELDLAEDCDHKPETAMYRCDDPACGCLWSDGERIVAIRQAEKQGGGWIAGKPFKGHASFHAPEMASTFRRMWEIVKSYLRKISLGDLQSFVNVSLGWPFENGDRIDPDSLQARCVEWAAQVPMRGLYLTAGVDAQEDRLEVEIVAWGEGEESWSVDYRVIWGSPLDSQTWHDLEDILAERYRHEGGAMLPISATCVDTGGSKGMTQAAYSWLRGKTGRRIFGVKGVGGWGRAIVEKPQRKQSGKTARKVDLFLVGTDEAKLMVAKRLAVKNEGPNYCHFPAGRDAEYFKQLTAERLVVRYVKGQPVREWHKGDRDRNEALDCRVYAYAALKILNPTFKRVAARLGIAAERLLPPLPAPPAPPGPDATPEDRKKWATEWVEHAMKMRKRTPPPVVAQPTPANDDTPPANPQEAVADDSKQNPATPKRMKRTTRGGGWVKNW